MATWAPIAPQIGLQPITDTGTTQKHPLGTRVKAKDVSNTTSFGEAEFIYLKGVASTAAADWVTYNATDFTTTRLAANAVGSVAVAMSANVASQYGWYCIFGKCNGLSANDIAINLPVYIGGTAAVDDAVVDGDLIHGAFSRSTITGAVATGVFELTYPFVLDTTGAD